MTRWGKAGVRLTPEQIAARRERARSHAVWRAQRAERDEKNAHTKWCAGLVVPHAITLALGDVSGPEVDQACAAEEPAVDLWEAGKLYPTWEQLKALAAYTGKTPLWFCQCSSPISAWDTSMRFHVSRSELHAPRPRIRFPDCVVAGCVGTDLWKERHGKTH